MSVTKKIDIGTIGIIYDTSKKEDVIVECIAGFNMNKKTGEFAKVTVTALDNPNITYQRIRNVNIQVISELQAKNYINTLKKRMLSVDVQKRINIKQQIKKLQAYTNTPIYDNPYMGYL